MRIRNLAKLPLPIFSYFPSCFKKILLALKVVKSDSEIIILLSKSLIHSAEFVNIKNVQNRIGNKSL